ncbi:MAG TPA: hypothetical protein V6C95_14900 [Coleofasciculaceae cyanobacterium]
MRYFPLLVLLPFSLSLPLLRAEAADFPLPLQSSTSSQEFWPQAEQLVQKQLNLITGIEKALAGPDFNRVEVDRAQLFLHLGVVERFLQSQYPIPRLLCENGPSSSPPPTQLTRPQQQVYCALYASTQRLKPMVSQLDQRLPMLAGLTASNPLSPADQPVSARFNLANPSPPRYAPVQQFPVPEPAVIAMPAKTAIEGQQEPIQPAIAPPEPAINVLTAARERLMAIVPVLPNSDRIIDPAPNAEIIARGTYGLWPADREAYAKFLNEPNTGISRVLPAESYRPDPNRLRNRLQPTVAEQFPFVPLTPTVNAFAPRFTVQLEDGNFGIAMPGVDYGFMMNLGDVSLDDINTNLRNVSTLSQEQRQFFLNYTPPNKFAALQLERGRLLTGKDEAKLQPSVDPSISIQAPVVLNNTYLVRLFQYELPEAVLTGEPISRAQRRYLDEILDIPSSDMLVAFRPVRQRSDGSYIVLWRVLHEFPSPKITDLDRYLQLD